MFFFSSTCGFPTKSNPHNLNSPLFFRTVYKAGFGRKMTTIQQLVNIHLKMVYQLRNWLPTCRLHSTHPSDVAPQELFPPHSASIHRGHVDVGDGHLIAYEISGQLNDSTAPVALHIHGGPGYHTTADDHRWFDPIFSALWPTTSEAVEGAFQQLVTVTQHRVIQRASSKQPSTWMISSTTSKSFGWR